MTFFSDATTWIEEIELATKKTPSFPFMSVFQRFSQVSFCLQTYAHLTKMRSSCAGLETSPQLVKTQWDALNLLKQIGFSVNDDNRKFDSFEDALHYATR